MAIEPQRFRPRSEGGGAATALERFQPTAAPVRRPDPVAPMAAPGVRAPQTTSNIPGLLDALQGFNNNLQQTGRAWAEADLRDQRSSAEADAQSLAERNAEVSSWAQAVAADPSLADRSPFYRGIFEERLARNAVSRAANRAFADYYASDIAGSTDPTAVNGWLSGRMGSIMDGLQGAPGARAAAADEIRQQSQQLIRMHQSRAAQNLVQQNEDSVESRFNAMVDGFAVRGGAGSRASWRGEADPGGLRAGMRQLEEEARAQGISGARLNTLMSRGLAAAAMRHGREDLLELGTIPREDGTPGFATTLDGRQAIERARESILNRRVARENLAYTQERRAREALARNMSTDILTTFVTQMEGGQVPTMTADQMRNLARVSPEALGTMMGMQSSFRSGQTNAENPGLVAQLELAARRGEVSETDIVNSYGSAWTNPETMRRLMGFAREARENAAVLNSPVFNTFVTDTQRAALGLEASGNLRDHVGAAQINRYILDEAAAFWRAHPDARNDTVRTMEHLRGVQDRVIRSYNPSGRWDENRTADVVERGTRRPPAPPSVGGVAVIRAPQPGQQALDWRTQPIAPSLHELNSQWTAFGEAVRNGGTPDPNNIFVQWAGSGAITDPRNLYNTQLGVIRRLQNNRRN